jgi:hypothetical protein
MNVTSPNKTAIFKEMELLKKKFNRIDITSQVALLNRESPII